MAKFSHTASMTYSKASNKTFREFVSWAGSNRRAATMVKRSESLVSLILSGDRKVTPDVAAAAEEASYGLYTRSALLWDTGSAGQQPSDAALTNNNNDR